MESTCDTTRSRKRCRSRSRKRQDGSELNGARKAKGAWSGRDVHAAGPWPSKSTPGRRTRRAYSCRRFRLTEYVLLFVWNVLRSFHALFVYFTYVSLASSSPRTAPSPFLHFLHFTPGVFFLPFCVCVCRRERFSFDGLVEMRRGLAHHDRLRGLGISPRDVTG